MLYTQGLCSSQQHPEGMLFLNQRKPDVQIFTNLTLKHCFLRQKIIETNEVSGVLMDTYSSSNQKVEAEAGELS